jgi:hypothetical protein
VLRGNEPRHRNAAEIQHTFRAKFGVARRNKCVQGFGIVPSKDAAPRFEDRSKEFAREAVARHYRCDAGCWTASFAW